MPRAFVLVLLAAVVCARPGEAAETPDPTLWTLLNTVEACSLAQAVDVQKQLKLSARQAVDMQRFVEAWQKKNQAFRKTNRRPSAAQCQQQYQAMLDEAQAIVSPEQLARLRQIEFQCDGVPAVALNHEEAGELFKLSDEQRQQLVQIESGSEKQRAEAFTRRMAENRNPLELFKGGGEAETTSLQEKNKRALALLKPEQQAAWVRLIGKPFKGRLTDAKGKKVHPRLESL